MAAVPLAVSTSCQQHTTWKLSENPWPVAPHAKEKPGGRGLSYRGIGGCNHRCQVLEGSVQAAHRLGAGAHHKGGPRRAAQACREEQTGMEEADKIPRCAWSGAPVATHRGRSALNDAATTLLLTPGHARAGTQLV